MRKKYIFLQVYKVYKEKWHAYHIDTLTDIMYCIYPEISFLAMAKHDIDKLLTFG